MTPEVAVPIVVTAMLVLAVAGTWSTPWRAAVIVPIALGASVALGAPELSGARGLLVEPVRAWAVHALIVAMAAAALLRISGSKRWGLIAAGAALALLGGHAAIVLGGLLVADAAFVVCSFSDRPITLHAGIGSRSVAVTLLTSDALLAIAVLIGSNGAAEPLAVTGGAVMTIALGARCVALLGIGRAQPAPAPLLLGAPILAPLGWLGASDARAIILIATLGAAVAAMRWARVSDPSSSAVALVLLAIAAGGVALPATLTLLPLLMFVAVAATILPELTPGGSMLIVAAAGGASLGVGGAILAAITERDDPWLRIASVAAIVALGSLAVGAFGVVRARTQRERGVLWRLPLGIVFGGLLVLIGVIPDRVVAAIDDAILSSRIPDHLVRTSVATEPWLPFAAVAAAVVLLAATLTPLRSALGERPEPAAEPVREIVSATLGEPSERWLQAVGVLAALAAALVLGILARSVSHGWL